MIARTNTPRLPRRKPSRRPSTRRSRGAVTRERPSVLIAWSDPDTHALAIALDRLITGAFGGRIRAWLSTRDLTARDWRADIQRAARESGASLLVVGPQSLDLDPRKPAWPRLLYQAGACFCEGATFAIGCGVESGTLLGTPLEAMRIWSPHDQVEVKAVMWAVGAALGEQPAPFDRQFAAAWPAFEAATRTIRGGVEERRRVADAEERSREEDAAKARTWALVRWVTTMALVSAALLVIALAPWAWAVWPSARPAPSCTTGSNEQRAQCEWERLVEAAADSPPTPDFRLAARVDSRPFAVVAFAPTCDRRAVAHDVRIVGQGASGDTWRLPVVFARSSAEPSTGGASAITLAIGDHVEVLTSAQCAAVANSALQVRHIGTLGDDRLCPTVRTLRRAFGGHPGFVDQFSGYLAGFGLGTADTLRPQVVRWLAQCGVS